MDTTKILLRCIYQADVIPKGARLVRRINLATFNEIEIETVASSAMHRGVIEVRPALDINGFVGQRLLSLDGYQGKLWSPMKEALDRNPQSNIANHPDLSVRDYIAAINEPTDGLFWGCDDPVMLSSANPASPAGSVHPPIDIVDEDKFDGKILWNNRAGMLHQYVEGAKSVLFVDDKVYTRRMEPHWRVTPSISGTANRTPQPAVLHLCGTWEIESRNDFSQAFRLDRLDEAVAWRSRSRNFNPAIQGELVGFNPAWISRDDISCMLREMTPFIVNAWEMASHLPMAALQQWKLLSDASQQSAASSYQNYGDGLAMPNRQAIAIVAELKTAVMDPALPYARHELRDAYVTPALDFIADRVQFERERRPALASEGGLAHEDSIALATM